MQTTKIPHGYVITDHYRTCERQAYNDDHSMEYEVEELKPINKRGYDTIVLRNECYRYALLEYCLRKEFDEKLKQQQEEIDGLKKALADTLAALAAK